jgi:hypothetical protein
LDLFQIQKNYNMAIYTSNHIGKWHWLKYDNNIVLVEEFTSNSARAVQAKSLIQGDAGVNVMSYNGVTQTCTLSSDVLLQIPQARFSLNSSVPTVVTPPFNPGYRDIFDLLISDFGIVKSNLFNQTFIQPRNLLTSASIQIGNSIRCTLNYNCYFDQLFQQIEFAEYFPQNFDFLARTAKNYDCRFYATEGNDQMLKVLSGSININVTYAKVFLLNLESDYPLYSPQAYEVSGTITVPTKNWYEMRDLFDSKIVSNINISLLVGNRYLRLGQTVIEDSLNLTMNDNLMTAEISFKGYARI